MDMNMNLSQLHVSVAVQEVNPILSAVIVFQKTWKLQNFFKSLTSKNTLYHSCKKNYEMKKENELLILVTFNIMTS